VQRQTTIHSQAILGPEVGISPPSHRTTMKDIWVEARVKSIYLAAWPQRLGCWVVMYTLATSIRLNSTTFTKPLKSTLPAVRAMCRILGWGFAMLWRVEPRISFLCSRYLFVRVCHGSRTRASIAIDLGDLSGSRRLMCVLVETAIFFTVNRPTEIPCS
jgi:hypothetical protein